MKILLIEDNTDHVQIIKNYLASSHLEVETIDQFSSFEEILTHDKKDYEVILLDLNLTDSTGLDTLYRVHNIYKNSPIIILTNVDDETLIKKALNQGAQDYLLKHDLTKKTLEDSITYSSNRFAHQNQVSRIKDQEIQKVKHKADLLLEIVPSGVFTVDMERRITTWNSMAEEITGYRSEEILGIECTKFAKSPCNDHCGLFDFDKEKPILGTECRIKTKSGRIRYISKNVNYLHDEEGNIIGGIESFQDITETKRQQLLHKVIYEINNAVFEYNDFYTLLGEIRKIFGQIVKTKNFLVATYNKKSETISIPFQANEVDQYSEVPIADTFTGYVIKTDQSLLLNEEKTNQMIKEGKAKMHGTPAKVWMGVPIRVRGEVFGVIVIQDYEDEKAFGYDELNLLEFASDQIGSAIDRIRSREELEKSARELRMANDTKDKFFSIISHDLKNPFLTLRGYLEILEEDYDELSDKEIKEIITALGNVSNKTYALLQDLLLWSRSQQDKLEVNLQSNSIDDLLEASIKPLMETANAKNVRLLVNKNSGHQVYCDSFMIKTVIRNLVSNAIKFTSADKEVKINCSQSGDKVFVSVEDDGVGMDKDTVDNLLKVDNPKSQKGTSGEEGTGLGLILCKDFVEKNNGKMEIESEVNKGTKITFHLPVQA